MSQVADIAATLERLGQVQAQGSANQGAIWGGTLANLGQTISQYPEQQARLKAQQQEGQIREMQISAAQRQQQDQQALDSAIQNSLTQGPDGIYRPDQDKVRQTLVRGGQAHLLPTMEESWAKSAKTQADLTEARQKIASRGSPRKGSRSSRTALLQTMRQDLYCLILRRMPKTAQLIRRMRRRLSANLIARGKIQPR